MTKGGTTAPTRRKTAGHKIGDTVKCCFSGSPWHTLNRVSDVVAHPTTGLASIVALDGEHDDLCLCSSRFEAFDRVDPNPAGLKVVK